MKNRTFVWLLSVGTLLITPLPATEAREDTAHLSLVKTAIQPEQTQTYTVQPGDRMDKILQRVFGDSEHHYAEIKQLNPKLKNINRVYPGQKLILPVKATGSKEALQPATSPKGNTITYRIKKGDSITRIVKRQLHIRKEDLQKTLKLVKQLNPGISDLNRIQIGKTILLPATGMMLTEPEILPSELQGSGNVKKEEMKPVLPAEKEMSFLKWLIGRSHGTLSNTGTYFIPLPKLGRLTLDCSLIPIVEFDDGSTVLVDFGNRVPASLQKLIETNWTNYHVVRVRAAQNPLQTFQEIINASASYTARKGGRPLILEKEPQILISPDLLISKKGASENETGVHGILQIPDTTQGLPEPLLRFAGKRGLKLTEIHNGQILTASSSLPNSSPFKTPTIAADNPLDLIYNLLVRLGYSPMKNQEVKLFKDPGEGFNFSVKTDLLVRLNQQDLLITSKQLPQQLLDLLSEQKKQVYVPDFHAPRKTMVTQILSAVHAPFSFGRYAFYPAGKGPNAKCSLTLPAIKIDREKSPLYLVDYDLDQDLYTLLNGNWKMEIVRY